MYTMVLMMAMGGSGDVSSFGGRSAGCSGCTGAVVASCKGDRGGFLGLRDRGNSCHGTVVASSCYGSSCHGTVVANSCYGSSCHGSMSCHGSDRGGFLGLRNRGGKSSCHGHVASGCHGSYYGGCTGYYATGTSCHGVATNCCGTVTTGCTGVIVGGAPTGAVAMPAVPMTTGKEGTVTKDPTKKEE